MMTGDPWMTQSLGADGKELINSKVLCVFLPTKAPSVHPTEWAPSNYVCLLVYNPHELVRSIYHKL